MTKTKSLPSTAGDLFDTSAPALPSGLLCREDFLTRDEEAALIAIIERLALAPAQYKQFTARRRVASYGGRYDFDANVLNAAPPLPADLHPLRDKAAAWLKVQPTELVHALVAEYAPGTPLGWHRDVPEFEHVVGISLSGHARMRLRPYPPRPNKREGVIMLELAPRSAYILRGDARWRWQHCIAPTKALRYSITFRTRRAVDNRDAQR